MLVGGFVADMVAWRTAYFIGGGLGLLLLFLRMSVAESGMSSAADLMLRGESPAVCYTIVFVAGFGIGYRAVFFTIAAELFGTNIRAAVATSGPNFVRAAVVPITLGFDFLKGSLGMIPAAGIVGAICLATAYDNVRKNSLHFSVSLLTCKNNDHHSYKEKPNNLACSFGGASRA